MKTKGVFS